MQLLEEEKIDCKCLQIDSGTRSFYMLQRRGGKAEMKMTSHVLVHISEYGPVRRNVRSPAKRG